MFKHKTSSQKLFKCQNMIMATLKGLQLPACSGALQGMLQENREQDCYKNRFMKCGFNTETLPVGDIYELSNQIKRCKMIQMITGTAIAILPTSASFCMIFLMRLCKEKQKHFNTFREITHKVQLLQSGAARKLLLLRSQAMKATCEHF